MGLVVLIWGRLCCSVSGRGRSHRRLDGLDARKVSHAAGQWMQTFTGTSPATGDGGACTLLLQVPVHLTWQLVSSLSVGRGLDGHCGASDDLASVGEGPLKPAQVPGGEWQGSCGHLPLPQLLLECGKGWLQA